MQFKILFHHGENLSVYTEKGELLKSFKSITLPEEISKLNELDINSEDKLIFFSKSAGISSELFLLKEIIPFFEVFHFFFPLLKSKKIRDLFHILFSGTSFEEEKDEGKISVLLFQKLLNKIAGLDTRIKEIIINLTSGTPVEIITKIVNSEFSTGFVLNSGEISDSLNDYLQDKIKKIDREISDGKISPDEIQVFFERLSKKEAWNEYELRPGQVSMAKKISEILGSEKHLVIEAGTGVGKSLAYLIPSIIYFEKTNKQVIIATKTKTLQEQLYYKDIPHLEKLTGKKFTYSIAKGRSNYLCLRKFFNLSRGNRRSIPSEQKYDLAKTYVWLFDTEFGDVNEIYESKESQWLANKLRSYDLDCIGKRCPFFRSCFVDKAKKNIRRTDLVIVNHALFFAGINIENYFSNLSTVIFDEAHSLEEIATNFFGLEISHSGFSRIAYFLFHYERGFQWGTVADIKVELKKKKLNEQLEKADEFVKELELRKTNIKLIFDQITDILIAMNKREPEKTRFRITLNNHLDEIKSQFEELKHELMAIISGLIDLQKLLLSLKGDNQKFNEDLELKKLSLIELKMSVEAILEDKLEDHVYILEKDEHDQEHAKLTALPINVGPMMNELVYPRIENIIFTSATLSFAGDFSFFKRGIGLDKLGETIENLIVPSPFDYKKNSKVIVPVTFPDPRDNNFTNALIEFLDQYLSIKKGRTLVLFTSYYMLNEVFEKLQHFDILAQGISGTRESILRRFKDDPEKKCIFGTDSFWEGIDLPGNLLTSLVIVKIPFPVPTDPLIEAKSEKIELAGGKPFFELSLPIAGIKLKQGFGRLIRRKTDTGIISILDNRLRTKRYGETLLANLPSKNYLFLRNELKDDDLRL